MASCMFCEIIAGRSPASVAYRDDACIAFMDIQPVNLGTFSLCPPRMRPIWRISIRMSAVTCSLLRNGWLLPCGRQHRS